MKRILIAIAATTVLAAPAMADMALAKSKNCMACHAVDKKLVGPSYKDVAGKYAGDKEAAAKLATKIMKGGAGVWGAIPMPANPQVSAEEAKKLADWILATKDSTSPIKSPRPPGIAGFVVPGGFKAGLQRFGQLLEDGRVLKRAGVLRNRLALGQGPQ